MERMPPHNLEAEQSVLGAVLLDPPSLSAVMDMLVPEDFYSGSHQVVFSAMRELFSKGQPVDVITVADYLSAAGKLEQAGGPAAISILPDRVATAANLNYWAQLVKQKSILRRVIHEATRIIATAYDEPEDIEVFLDETENKILEISMAQVTTTYQPIRAIVKDSFALIEKYAEEKKQVTGVPSGYPDLDKLTHGFQPSDLCILAGRPSMGKTALALNIARHAALEAGKTIAIFSMEMAREHLVMRMLCGEARVEAERVRSGFIEKRDWPKLTTAVGLLADASIFIDDSSSLSVLEMKAKCRRIQAEKGGLDLVVVDYLQLIKGSGARRGRDSRENEISEISRNLKAFAKELRVPVLALSQLNRAVEQREDKRPRLSDLRESGAIEQDADLVMFIHRPSLYKSRRDEAGETNLNAELGADVDSAEDSLAEVIIGKQRNGPIGIFRLTFLKEFTLFVPYEGRYDESFAPEALR